MKRWKSFFMFAFLGLTLSWLVSCGTSQSVDSPSPKTAEVEFWTMQLQPKFTDYFNQLIADFETENPGVKVRWVDVPWSAMESKILTAVAAKTAPDVVNLNPDFASTLASRNAWLELDPYINQSDRDLYLPKIWQANTLNGKTFGIPWYLTTRVTIYNTQLLEQAGITQPPTTYAELAQVAQQVRNATGKYAFFTTVVPEDSAEILESLVQMGVQLVDENGQAAFNTPQGKAAFQYWVDLYKNQLLPREVLTQGHRRAIELYQAGEIAILSSGPEFLNAIATNAPAIADVSAAGPQITGDTQKRNVAVMNLAIPRDTDQPENALKFALFVTNPDNQLAFAQAANVLPSTINAIERYKSELEKQPLVTPVEKARNVSASQLPTAEVLIPAKQDLNILQKAIYDNLQAAMLGEKTVDRAVEDAAAEWNRRS
ncbi:MAG: sugar ABC transporter substrate-binding protein [Desertifilum sp.]|nr:sugar ABC transporter substrate-binding protein [Desertifilum sp.]